MEGSMACCFCPSCLPWRSYCACLRLTLWLQLEGLNWLYQGWQGRRNLILADEMGLGKTVQVG